MKRLRKVKTLSALDVTFPAKDLILFVFDLHFLAWRLTGTKTYWARLDGHYGINLNTLSANFGKVSVPPVRGVVI